MALGNLGPDAGVPLIPALMALVMNGGLVGSVGLSLGLEDWVRLASNDALNLEIAAGLNKLFVRRQGRQ